MNGPADSRAGSPDGGPVVHENHTPSIQGVEDLAASIAEERAEARRTSRVLIGVTTAMLLICGGSVFSMLSHVRSEWTEDRVARSLEREAEAIAPQVADQLAAMAGELAPVYGSEAGRQYQSMAPQIRRRVVEELDRFVLDVVANTRNRVNDSEERIRALTLQAVNEVYPELDTPEEKARFVQMVSDTAIAALHGRMKAFQERVSMDTGRLREAIVNFRVHDEGLPTIELQRRFLHLWLMIIDEELMRS
jgi:hypothetical protein